MGLTPSKVIENDALVVLCLRDMADTMSHHQFAVRARALGFTLSRSQCHNLLSRAGGRVTPIRGDGVITWTWRLTAAGLEYRLHVLDRLSTILTLASNATPPRPP